MSKNPEKLEDRDSKSENSDKKSENSDRENFDHEVENVEKLKTSHCEHNFEGFKSENFQSDFFNHSKAPNLGDNLDKKSENLDQNSENFDDLVENLENSEDTAEKEDPNLEDKLLIEKLRTIELELTEEEKISKKSEAENLKILGNTEFKNEKFEKSIEIYTKALETCPLRYQNERAILYANRAASNLKLDLDQKALGDCNRALELYPDYFKALLRRAKILEKLEKYEEALEDYKKLNLLQPDNVDVMHSLFILPKKIEERNAKMKEEMLGKLKDLGNMILRPFGLSTDNFQVNQDPNSGGYSINFQQNKPN